MKKLIGVLTDSEFAEVHEAIFTYNEGKCTLAKLKELLEYAEAMNHYGISAVTMWPDSKFAPHKGICSNANLNVGFRFGEIYLAYDNEPMNKPHWWNNWGKWFRYKGHKDYPVGEGYHAFHIGSDRKEMYIGDYGLKRIHYLKWLIALFEEFIQLEDSNAGVHQTPESTVNHTV